MLLVDLRTTSRVCQTPGAMKRHPVTIAVSLAVLLGGCDSTGEPDSTAPTTEAAVAPTFTTAAPSTTLTASVPDAAGPEVEWTQHPFPEGFRVHTITRAGDRLFGLARDEIEQPDPRTRLWVSNDGISWDPIDVDATRLGMRAGYFRDLAQVGDGYVAVVKGELLSTGVTDLRLVTSGDGRVWDPVDIGDSYAVSVAGDESGAIALTRSLTDSSQSVWYSSGGTEWEIQTTSSDTLLHTPVMVKGVFYAVASPDDQRVLYASAHGADWVSVELPESLETGTALYPGEVTGYLALLALHSSGPAGPGVWIMTSFGDWVDFTPPDFDPLPGPNFDPIVDSNLGAAFIVDPGYENRVLATPAVIWVVGDPWVPIAMDDVVGTEGSVPAAAALDHKIVILYQEWGSGGMSLWTGELVDNQTPDS